MTGFFLLSDKIRRQGTKCLFFGSRKDARKMHDGVSFYCRIKSDLMDAVLGQRTQNAVLGQRTQKAANPVYWIYRL